MNFLSQNILARVKELLFKEICLSHRRLLHCAVLRRKCLFIFLVNGYLKNQTKKVTRICVNEDQIKLSYIELEKLGITQPRATRGFDDLLAKGFIKIEHHGGGVRKIKAFIACLINIYFGKKERCFQRGQTY